MLKIMRIIIMLLLPAPALSQYQKTIHTHVFTICAGENYYEMHYLKQQAKNACMGVSAMYAAIKETHYRYASYVFDLNYQHRVLRLQSLYLNGSFGVLYSYLSAKDILGNKTQDYAAGISGSVCTEYYLTNRFILSVRARQLHFWNSDYFDDMFVYGFGLGMVF